MRRLGRRVSHLSDELAETEHALAQLVAELAPDLLNECGAGPVCAAQLLVSTGNPARMRNEASLAALAGTSPVEASRVSERHSGLTQVTLGTRMLAILTSEGALYVDVSAVWQSTSPRSGRGSAFRCPQVDSSWRRKLRDFRGIHSSGGERRS